MKKLINPFDNNCMGCSLKNASGLHMEFQYDEENKILISKWSPNDTFQSYPNILHGGVQSLMIDEIAAWSNYIFMETAGVTKNLTVNYLKPVYLSNDFVTLMSRVKSIEKNLTIYFIELYDSKGKLCTTGEAEYFVYPQRIAVKKFQYPGLDAFFED